MENSLLLFGKKIMKMSLMFVSSPAHQNCWQHVELKLRQIYRLEKSPILSVECCQSTFNFIYTATDYIHMYLKHAIYIHVIYCTDGLHEIYLTYMFTGHSLSCLYSQSHGHLLVEIGLFRFTIRCIVNSLLWNNINRFNF